MCVTPYRLLSLSLYFCRSLSDTNTDTRTRIHTRTRTHTQHTLSHDDTNNILEELAKRQRVMPSAGGNFNSYCVADGAGALMLAHKHTHTHTHTLHFSGSVLAKNWVESSWMLWTKKCPPAVQWSSTSSPLRRRRQTNSPRIHALTDVHTHNSDLLLGNPMRSIVQMALSRILKVVCSLIFVVCFLQFEVLWRDYCYCWFNPMFMCMRMCVYVHYMCMCVYSADSALILIVGYINVCMCIIIFCWCDRRKHACDCRSARTEGSCT